MILQVKTQSLAARSSPAVIAPCKRRYGLRYNNSVEPRFKILLEDGPVLAVIKPSGLPTQAPTGIDSLEVQVKSFIKERDRKPGGIYLAIVHRLDRPVSGAVVLAKHVRAARRISEQFESRQVQKTYWACVSGVVEPPEGTWTDTMRKIPDLPQAELVEADLPGAQTAVLHYRTLGRSEHGSWLEVTLETGRMHQIRLQSASRGHPVLGDAQYGSQVPFGQQHDDYRLRAIALHARSIRFRHPMNREWLNVSAPVPSDWHELVVDVDEASTQP